VYHGDILEVMPTPSFYNSLSKKIEEFAPLSPEKVTIYHCGPTVYKRQHLGNMRRFLFADFLRRSLEFLGYTVHEVTNITDVGHLTQDEIDAGEDKMAVAAREQKITPQDIAHAETEHFFTDIDAFNIQRSHEYPRASDHIADMQALIATLIEKKHAYVTSSGIYFDVTSFPQYGALSGNTLEQLAAGKRIEVREEKHHPADFALWIFDDTALQKWDSPWGPGYPGWHIECSAMSMKYLGTTLDIHTGGEDNRFPHHENEIAQSQGVTDKPFVSLWLHNRHLQLGGKKMAKREGEQLTLDSLTERGYSPLAFRLLAFSSHYRMPLDFSWEAMDAAQENLKTIERLVRRLPLPLTPSPRGGKGEEKNNQLTLFKAALADDLNTPQALAAFLSYVSQANASLDSGQADPESIWGTLLHFDRVLGVIEPLAAALSKETVPAEVLALADQREAARRNKQFEKADQLRQEIEQQGFTILDTPAGPRLEKRIGD
jgi:cysteinyl-tRNA synthetase